jgi:hypothetical protein
VRPSLRSTLAPCRMLCCFRHRNVGMVLLRPELGTFARAEAVERVDEEAALRFSGFRRRQPWRRGLRTALSTGAQEKENAYRWDPSLLRRLYRVESGSPYCIFSLISFFLHCVFAPPVRELSIVLQWRPAMQNAFACPFACRVGLSLI